jgi:hypothetical protein
MPAHERHGQLRARRLDSAWRLFVNFCGCPSSSRALDEIRSAQHHFAG